MMFTEAEKIVQEFKWDCPETAGNIIEWLEGRDRVLLLTSFEGFNGKVIACPDDRAIIHVLVNGKPVSLPIYSLMDRRGEFLAYATDLPLESVERVLIAIVSLGKGWFVHEKKHGRFPKKEEETGKWIPPFLPAGWKTHFEVPKEPKEQKTTGPYFTVPKEKMEKAAEFSGPKYEEMWKKVEEAARKRTDYNAFDPAQWWGGKTERVSFVMDATTMMVEEPVPVVSEETRFDYRITIEGHTMEAKNCPNVHVAVWEVIESLRDEGIDVPKGCLLNRLYKVEKV